MSVLQRPQPRPGVLAIDPYVPGKSTAPGLARVIKLSSNETPLGPSPRAVAAYHAVGEHLEDYPDGDSTALREAIGRAFGLDPNRIVCGAGSDELLNLIADAYLLDAAYAEYVRRNDYEAGIELVATCENVVMCRTFSKIHGLAALRLGWLYGPAHVVDAINRIRGPFNVNSPAMAAGIAALEDSAHLEAARAHNEKWLDWLLVEIRKLGLEVTPSIANFVLIHFSENRGRTAEDADAFLTQRGLILRRVKAYKLPHALRMTVGTEEANRLVVAALAEFMGRKP